MAHLYAAPTPCILVYLTKIRKKNRNGISPLIHVLKRTFFSLQIPRCDAIFKLRHLSALISGHQVVCLEQTLALALVKSVVDILWLGLLLSLALRVLVVGDVVGAAVLSLLVLLLVPLLRAL